MTSSYIRDNFLNCIAYQLRFDECEYYLKRKKLYRLFGLRSKEGENSSQNLSIQHEHNIKLRGLTEE